jgi:hypothetical protein
MSEATLIRQNLMDRENYSPYCMDCSTMARTFWNGSQFECSCCGWVSEFPSDFIERFKVKWPDRQSFEGRGK